MAIDIFSLHPILFSYLGVINIAAFCMYGSDKLFAKAGAWRVRERTLLALALFGGSVGALVTMQLFRHKTKKPLFGLLFVVILLLQIALTSYLYKQALTIGPVMVY